MIRRGILLFAFAALVAIARSASAHFIWIDFKPAEPPGAQARLYFGELPEPGEPHLIAKVAHTKAWLRTADGAKDLKIGPAADNEPGVLSIACAAASPASLEASCDYGVYERGPAAVLLQYYARHLLGDWQSQADKLARAERLALDIVPRVEQGSLKLQVLYQGKPAEDCQVVVIDPTGKDHELKTDAKGNVELAPAPAGRYAVRAGYIDRDRAGERDGKKFTQTWYYSTLTFDVAGAAPSSGGSVSAAELLRRARAARAVWQDFPGFSAELTVYGAGRQVAAKATISADGTVALEMPDSPLAQWTQEQLDSLVQHRMPDGEVSEGDVVYADDDLAHPLGRKIDLGDASMQSVYRITGDTITEVNRAVGKMRFTISVLETIRNAEDKYLPRSFTMNFFDAASGELKNSLGYWNDWQRVGGFDLPKTILEIGAHPGGTTVKRIVFDNCRLADKK